MGLGGPLEFGVCLPIFAGAGDAHPRTPMLEQADWRLVSETAREAERLGYHSVWVADHLMLGLRDEILECWTVLSALAAMTNKMRLGTIHICNLFRNPALLAKMAATLDSISGGRLDLFVEAGHRGSIGEATAYGYSWAPDEVRAEMLVEAIQVIKALWTGGRVSFDGKYYRIKDAVCRPRPTQSPHPPIWIGTISGEPFTEELGMDDRVIDIVARYADVWNNTPGSVEHCRAKIDQLRSACRSAGRDFGELRLSLETQVLITKKNEDFLERIKRLNPEMRFYRDASILKKIYVIGTPDECAERIREYAELGITIFTLWFMDYPSFDGLEAFSAEVIPRLSRR